MANYSKQKEIVLSILKNSKSHPTAQEVFLKAREFQPNIAKGTVYRNLDILSKSGQIKQISIQNCSDRFDYMRFDHSHAICPKCGKIYDFDYDINCEGLCKEVLNQTNIELELPVSITVQGICKECRSNK